MCYVSDFTKFLALRFAGSRPTARGRTSASASRRRCGILQTRPFSHDPTIRLQLWPLIASAGQLLQYAEVTKNPTEIAAPAVSRKFSPQPTPPFFIAGAALHGIGSERRPAHCTFPPGFGASLAGFEDQPCFHPLFCSRCSSGRAAYHAALGCFN